MNYYISVENEESSNMERTMTIRCRGKYHFGEKIP